MERQPRGQSLVEYSLILVLIAVVAIGVLLIMGGEIKNIFNSIAGALRQGG
jgi:Flp pilus assembly pilin Flp